jgi:putative ABC transport system permease protein
MKHRFRFEWGIAWLLLVRCTLRHWRQSWPSYFALVAIVAVGVGAYLGIRQASRAATANFGLFNEAVSGRSDFLIEAPVGPIDEERLDDFGVLAGDPDWHLLPVVEGTLTALDESGDPLRTLRVVGLDLVALGNLPTLARQDVPLFAEGADWRRILDTEGGVWAMRPLAEGLGWSKGDKREVIAAGQVRQVEVLGVLGDDEAGLPDDLLVGDLPVIQQLLGREGRIDRIEVLLSDRRARAESEYVEAMRKRLEAELPEGVELMPASERAEERASMTAAFRMNLAILSLIAIVVGAYLILQALDAAVVRRRLEMATLKSLGVRSGTMFAVGMIEALVIGAIGSVAGVGVGSLLASGAVHLLADTVNALYFATSVEAVRLQPGDWLLGLLIGIGFSLLAGLLPARDATETPPAQILARGDWSPGFVWLRRPWTGLALLALAGLALLIPPLPLEGGGKMPLGGFITATALVLGGALLSGQLLVVLARMVRPLFHGPVGRLAVSRLEDGSSRHRLAVAGLVVAVGMVTSMLQMVGSFRATIERWFDVRFQGDLYVSERGASGSPAFSGIDPQVIDRLMIDPAVELSDTLYVARVDGPVGVTQLCGADLDNWQGRVQQIWVRPPGELTPVADAEPALVSESFARRFGVLDGGRVEITTAAGRRAITPLGVFADYGNEFGSAVVAIERWKEWTHSERPINTMLFLADGLDVNAVRDRMRLEHPGLEIRNGPELRAAALDIFDQTFRVTDALSAIGLAVALAGLLLGLLAIFNESATTWETLDRLGFSRRRLVLAAGIEGAGISLAAWLAGTALGLLIGWLLIDVINVQSFGWTLLWQVPIGHLVVLGVSLTIVGFACGAAAGAWWFRKHQALKS